MSQSQQAGFRESSPAAGAPAAAVPVPDARTAPRKLLAGRVKLTTDSGFRQDGRLLDLSNGGLSATMDDPIRSGVLCLLDCEIPRNGKTYTLSVIAKTIECVLVRGKGYRIGLQFQKVSDGSVAVLRTLLR